MSLQLKNLESLLYRLITAPSGVAEGIAAERHLPAGGLESVIVGDEGLSAEQHLDIYADMYFYRLLDVLKEDYPATAAVLGETNFHNLITGYLIEYPPTEPSVLWAGKNLPAYLCNHPLLDEVPFAADLAMLERATIDVFCAADTAILEDAEMRSIAPERWANVKMRRVPASMILNAQWRIVPILEAIESKSRWEPPSLEANRILVWRCHSRVSYRELGEREADALGMLDRAVAFGKACEVLSRDVPEDEAPVEISRTFARWLADGVLMRSPQQTRTKRRSRRGDSAAASAIRRK
jgi:hypothetical protein